MLRTLIVCGCAWLAALLLSTGPGLAQDQPDIGSALAWTNLVVGRGWGTNTQSAWLAATNAAVAAAAVEEREELQRLLAADDDAQAEADRLLQEHARYRAQGAAVTEAELELRLKARFIAVRSSYEQFLNRHPTNLTALLAYGSLLDDLGEDAAAATQWEKARALQPKNPAAWNNLANHYAANGNELKAFSYYEQAIAVATNPAPYQRNLGSAIINLRSNAMTYFSLGEQEVLTRGLGLLRQAEPALPEDFTLATEIGQVLYALRPLRTNELLAAWQRAAEKAGDDTELEGVRLHQARANLLAGNVAPARALLATVTNAAFANLRQQLEAQLARVAPPPAGSQPVPGP